MEACIALFNCASILLRCVLRTLGCVLERRLGPLDWFLNIDD